LAQTIMSAIRKKRRVRTRKLKHADQILNADETQFIPGVRARADVPQTDPRLTRQGQDKRRSLLTRYPMQQQPSDMRERGNFFHGDEYDTNTHLPLDKYIDISLENMQGSVDFPRSDDDDTLLLDSTMDTNVLGGF